MDKEFGRLIKEYESYISACKNRISSGEDPECKPNIYTFVKAIDSLEAMLHLFKPAKRNYLSEPDFERKQKLQKAYKRKLIHYFTPFPILSDYYKILFGRFEEQGLF